MKREVQRRISRNEVFALVCAELLSLREFAFKCGTDARNKAIRRLARALSRCGPEQGSDDRFSVGHMGGGYFVCIVGADQAEEYCRRVTHVWQSHLASLYESVGSGNAYQQSVKSQPGDRSVPILEPLVCVTKCQRKNTLSSQELFDVLMKIRSKALASKTPGVHLDRRA
jgi:GGDEF domain-containing protein